ncbi:hypothetical protein H072_2673 [Dactylellina haptotyla CBS 200.50]|uniref:Pyridoxal phosphate-dependent transferase n=1 Tax=Dactylellina haptotyla (strain CBS 200.50) TaxID=1284197 RepID=S8C6T5_DACHA|nr:hypothetical protein H072_2673 [Dactylellina haptotyla CBS 200.50]
MALISSTEALDLELSEKSSSLVITKNQQVSTASELGKDTKPGEVTLVVVKYIKEVPISTKHSLVPTKRLIGYTQSHTHGTYTNSAIRRTFLDSQIQWISNPVISKWRDPRHRIHDLLNEVSELHEKWTHASTPKRPFSPAADPLWLEPGRLLAQAGLPWYNNQLSMPNELDTSFPYHFKSFEQKLIREKGTRVGDPDACGYFCDSIEANCYGIRALQQELRKDYPTLQPVVLYDSFNEKDLLSAKVFFGLQLHRIDLQDELEDIRRRLAAVLTTAAGVRPVIFAATLASSGGYYDDLNVICRLSQIFPLMLHVDASRNFDYITTLSHKRRKQLGVQKLTLSARKISQPLQLRDGSIAASTISAGGVFHVESSPVIVLKPTSLGGETIRVEYIQASDSSLAGSRDALTPLWMAIQEMRFGAAGFRDIYKHCASLRNSLVQILRKKIPNLVVLTPPYSLDVIFKHCSQEQIDSLTLLGGISACDGEIVLSMQPSVTEADLASVVDVFSRTANAQTSRIEVAENDATEKFSKMYPIPASISGELSRTVDTWKILTRSAAGYPVNMSFPSALGPVIGHFLDVDIPADWIKEKSKEIFTERMKSFGLEPGHMSSFKGAFTTGSTMGNRMGIHVALLRLPGAHVYFSSETHYSVKKTMRDCDDLTNRWIKPARKARYSQIPCDEMGRILPGALVKQALLDRDACQRRDEEYYIILVANSGTTFVGASDDLKDISSALKKVGLEISHIHVDGALNFGFGNFGAALGPPGKTTNGVPCVQGVSFSHHKAMGSMVSGEVLCYCPGEELSSLEWSIDPRSIFETWLYSQAFTKTDKANILKYCLENASRLESGLKRLGISTKRNPDSITVVLERIPSWIIEEFSLRPEGDWVHFITMPHVSPETVDLFVDRISWVQRQCLITFSYVQPMIEAVIQQTVTISRLRCQGSMAEKIAELSKTAIPLVSQIGYTSSLTSAVVASGIRSSLSVVILDQDTGVEAVLLIETFRQTAIRIGPLLIKSIHADRSTMIGTIARQLAGFLARHMNIGLQLNSMSYMPFAI